MKKEYRFEVETKWKNGQFENSKTHLSHIDGKEELIISAAREFKGESTKHNPEDLLLRALSSCHMMSYFYVCKKHSIDLITYEGNAVGILKLKEDLSGEFTKVELKPIITIIDSSQKSLALKLHKKAHQLCFIANSVNFEVLILPQINIL